MRLDEYLLANGFYRSRTKAAQAISESCVLVDGKVKKPSYEVKEGDDVRVIEKQRFVSLGGYKLDKALTDFGIDPEGLEFADIGASSGGFTDCLLQRGAKRVVAVDVGEGLLDEKLRNDGRVSVVENFNARALSPEAFGTVDAAVADCSFISLKLILGAVFSVVKDGGFVIALIKPQFECGKKALNKKGIVQSAKARLQACEEICDYADSLGIKTLDFTGAPIKDGKNREYLILLSRRGEPILKEKIAEVVNGK